MLVLSRKKGEAIMLGDSIELIVLAVEGEQIRLGIKAPKDVQVFRKEVYLSIQSSNVEASASPIDPKQLSALFGKTKKTEDNHFKS